MEKAHQDSKIKIKILILVLIQDSFRSAYTIQAEHVRCRRHSGPHPRPARLLVACWPSGSDHLGSAHWTAALFMVLFVRWLVHLLLLGQRPGLVDQAVELSLVSTVATSVIRYWVESEMKILEADLMFCVWVTAIRGPAGLPAWFYSCFLKG